MGECKPVPHPHAEIIKAWADGITVQVKSASCGWYDIEPPSERICVPEFNKGWVYRIKPEPSDLERYGVCVGDLWLLEEGNVYFNYLVTRTVSSPYHTEGILVGTGARKELRLDSLEATLALRRGEVNKL